MRARLALAAIDTKCVSAFNCDAGTREIKVAWHRQAIVNPVPGGFAPGPYRARSEPAADQSTAHACHLPGARNVTATGIDNERNWFGHPAGLTILFLTETWEKFSFYGMRALLVYYLVKQVGFSQPEASLIYGAYSGCIYLTPIVGGYIADRWLGRRRSVILGGAIMTVGHAMMATPQLLFAALAMIVIGNGFYLPNLASQIKGLYPPDDTRRASAYSVYYVGVNIGGFLAPLVCGTLGELYGWHWGFGAAGVGMALGLIIYTLGGPLLPPEPRKRPAEQTAERSDLSLRALVPVLALVMVAVVIYRGAYEQIGNTIALWADTSIDRSIGSFTIPGSWFQALNPLLVFALTPLLVRRWIAAAAHGNARSPLTKMALGAAGLMLAYLGLAIVTLIAGDARLHWMWLVAFIGLLTLAELYILPTGLALFAQIAPPGHQATTVAIWFLGLFAGNLLAGAMGTLWQALPREGYFLVMAGLAAGAAGILIGLDRRAQQLGLTSTSHQ